MQISRRHNEQRGFALSEQVIAIGIVAAIVPLLLGTFFSFGRVLSFSQAKSIAAMHSERVTAWLQEDVRTASVIENPGPQSFTLTGPSGEKRYYYDSELNQLDVSLNGRRMTTLTNCVGFSCQYVVEIGGVTYLVTESFVTNNKYRGIRAKVAFRSFQKSTQTNWCEIPLVYCRNPI